MIAFAYGILKICYEKLHTNKTVSNYYYSNIFQTVADSGKTGLTTYLGIVIEKFQF